MQVPEIKVEYVNKMCEFRVIRGLCGRTVWNLHNLLEFYRVLCWGRCLKHNTNRLISGANFVQFAEYIGKLRGFCLICLNFAQRTQI